MKRKIAILRGINVGGKRKILMSDLKSMCTQLGWEDVQAYIQSGNLIFSADQPNPKTEAGLERAIAEKYEFDVPVIVRNSEEFRAAVGRNPFFAAEADTSQLHVTFLKEKPAKEHEERTMTTSYEPDKFKIDGKEVFICCEGSYHKSKLSNQFFEKNLKIEATTRNWKTVLKLAERLKG